MLCDLVLIEEIKPEKAKNDADDFTCVNRFAVKKGAYENERDRDERALNGRGGAHRPPRFISKYKPDLKAH